MRADIGDDVERLSQAFRGSLRALYYADERFIL